MLAVPLAMLMPPVKSVRRQLFRLTGIADEPEQRPHQPRVMFEKESFEDAVRNVFRLVRQNECLLNRLHTR